MPNNKPEIANTMISDRFELFHVADYVQPTKTTFHYHDHYEIHCTLSGIATFFLDGSEYTLTPGTVLLIHYNDLHRIVNQSSTFFERVYLFVTPRFLQSRSTPTSNLEACFKSMGGASRVLKLDVDTLRDYLKPLDQSPAKTFGADILFENHLLNFLIFLNQVVLSQDAIATPKNTIKNKTIRDLIEYINDHLDGDLTLDTIAETFFTNKYYISREFKKQTGFTFHTYVLKKRLLFSKQLLRQFESASEVYRQCGFNSYTHFLRCFKQEFHLTPKEFLAKEKQVDFVQYDHSKY